MFVRHIDISAAAVVDHRINVLEVNCVRTSIVLKRFVPSTEQATFEDERRLTTFEDKTRYVVDVR